MAPLDLPRFGLIDGPSPLLPAPRFGEALGGRVEIWLKREDLLPVAFGGNKLRNLEYLVGAALADRADTLVTSGRRWSNHCRLTAAAGARAGLGVHLVLSGPPIDPPGPNQRLDELLGATVHVTATADRTERDATVSRITEELRSAGRRPYVVGVGGGGWVGAYGQLTAALELASQLRAAGGQADAIVVPSATGGTQAGLIVGTRIEPAVDRVVGVAVAHPPDDLRPAVERLVTELAERTSAAVSSADIELDGRFLGPGYGRPTPEAEEAQRLLARTEGVLVDPIYTAKALAALVSDVRDRRWDGGRVVFWHAGGTPGLFEPLET